MKKQGLVSFVSANTVLDFCSGISLAKVKEICPSFKRSEQSINQGGVILVQWDSKNRQCTILKKDDLKTVRVEDDSLKMFFQTKNYYGLESTDFWDEDSRQAYEILI